MATIVTRAGKGSPLTNTEVDANFTNLNTDKAELSGAAFTGAITTNSTVDGRDLATDGTKLDTVETNADVTDATNVTAAGALMDSELTDIASVKALDQGVATTDSPTFAAATVTGEITANGGIALGDNDKATFGAGDDLQIYHDGSNSYIEDSGTGVLFIKGTGGVYLRGKDSDEDLGRFLENGAVDLYYNGSSKLATTSTGIDVTGTVTADGLIVDTTLATIGSGGSANQATELRLEGTSNAANGAFLRGRRGGSSSFLIGDTAGALGSGTGLINYVYDSNPWIVYTNANERLTVEGNGDISFYEDTGTTPKFFWDASAESLGIGTTSPARDLHIVENDNWAQIRLEGNSSGGAEIMMGDSTTESKGRIQYVNGSNYMRFDTNATERMRIDSSGNVKQNSVNTSTNVGYSVNNGTYDAIALGTGGFGVNGGAATDGGIRAYNNLLFGTGASATERMRIDSSGNLGIGTSSPSNTYGTNLHVNSTATSSAIKLTNSSTGTGASDGFELFGSGVNTYLLNREAGFMYFGTSNTERMRIDSSGNLLVGTTDDAPGAGNTQSGVAIRGGSDNRSFFSASSNYAMHLNRNTSDGTILYFAKNGTAVGSIGTLVSSLTIGSGDTGLILQPAYDRILPFNVSTNAGRDNVIDLGASGSRFKDLYLSSKTKYQASGGNQHSIGADANDLIIRSETAGSETARFTYGGNLLVGKSTTDFGTVGIRLEGPNGKIEATRSNNVVMDLNRINGNGDILVFSANTSPVGSIGSFGGTDLLVGSGASGLRFRDAVADNIQPYNTNGTSADGNIDLGAASERFKDLYLSGTALARSYRSTGTSVGALGLVTTGSTLSVLSPDTTSYGYGVSTNSSGGLDIMANQVSQPIRFWCGTTNTAGTVQERMRIDGSGNLLVGTTSTSVTNTTGIQLFPADGGANKPRINISTAGYTSAEYPLSIWSTAVGAWRFYVQADGTISAVNTTITSLSDQRVKENVRDLDDGLAKVMQLQPRKFDWKKGKGKDISDDRGFIAQEFEQVFPDMISEWKDEAPEGEEAYKAINANLIPTLVKAIQEQQTLIESLTTRIAALEE